MREIPQLRALVERHGKEGFEVLGINTDKDPALYRRRVDKRTQGRGLPWKDVWEGSRRGPLATRWAVRSFPFVFLVDKHGVLHARDLLGEAIPEAVSALLQQGKKE